MTLSPMSQSSSSPLVSPTDYNSNFNYHGYPQPQPSALNGKGSNGYPKGYPPAQPLTQQPQRKYTTSPLGIAHNSLSLLPTPGLIRRPSRFDPMGIDDDDDNYGELGPRHPLRRICEDDSPAAGPSILGGTGIPDHHRDRAESISLPGIKSLFNAADQPPASAASFTGSIYSSPSLPALSATSPLGSPSSHASRFTSLASSSAGGQGWWAPDERSNAAYPQPRIGSYSTRILDDEPDHKRRRSDLPPTVRDADEVARLKWQAQSRNASFPVSSTLSPVGQNLRSMLYPPPAASATVMRGSMSGPSGGLGTPLSPPLENLPYDYRRDSTTSSRSSSFAGPLARSFADLTASERSPSIEIRTPSQNRSPIDRRPSLYSRPSGSNESVPQLPSLRESLSAASGTSGLVAGIDESPRRVSMTRPPSPEPASKTIRRSSLTELIMANSGDDVAIANGGFFTPTAPQMVAGPSSGPFLASAAVVEKRGGPDPALATGQPWPPRRESTESLHSVKSVPGVSLKSDTESTGSSAPRKRSAKVAAGYDPRLPYDPSKGGDDDDVDAKGGSRDPAMRGMDVLAESARRVADAERKDRAESEERESSPSKGGAGGSSGGPKYACAFCAKTFSRPSSLRIHTYSHTGERPFVCKEPSCRRRFSVQSNLKRHAKVHQLAAQNAQMGANGGGMLNIQRSGPGQPHPLHPGLPQPHAPPHMHVYGYPHPAHPSHPSQMGHPPPPGYASGPGGPPPPLQMQGYQSHPPPPPPGYETQGNGQPPHFQPVLRVPQSDHMQAHYRELQRRRSHDVDPASARTGAHNTRPGASVSAAPAERDEWSDEEEVDELDEDD